MCPFQPSAREGRIIALLRNHPHTAEELADELSLASPRFLPMDRLEECGIVQRCGLTPTDVLHVQGTYLQWDPAPARKMLCILADLCKKSVAELVEELLEKIEKALALELLRHLIANDCRDVHQIDPALLTAEELARAPIAQHLINCILKPSGSSAYAIKTELHIPVIGVGAPVGFFLSGAEKILNTQVVIPPDGDVANALGAVTSLIAISQRLVIRPDGLGQFVVDGIVGTQHFTDLQQAQDWSIKHLHESVRRQGIKAGTSNQAVHITVNDSVVNTAQGVALFLERAYP